MNGSCCNLWFDIVCNVFNLMNWELEIVVSGNLEGGLVSSRLT
jgi:hypothetical protein